MSRAPGATSEVADTMRNAHVRWLMAPAKRERDQMIERSNVPLDVFVADVTDTVVTFVDGVDVDGRNKSRLNPCPSPMFTLTAFLRVCFSPILCLLTLLLCVVLIPPPEPARTLFLMGFVIAPGRCSYTFLMFLPLLAISFLYPFRVSGHISSYAFAPLLGMVQGIEPRALSFLFKIRGITASAIFARFFRMGRSPSPTTFGLSHWHKDTAFPDAEGSYLSGAGTSGLPVFYHAFAAGGI